MREELIKIGDEVVITIPQESRYWGYNPCPDGTKATVLGFSEIHYGRIGNFGLKPGVYVNRCWVRLRLADGREHIELYFRFELVDQEEYKRRESEFTLQRMKGTRSWRETKEFLRELPETPFYEGDKVRVKGFKSPVVVVTGEMPPDYDPTVFVIVGINYEHLDQSTNNGGKYPAYRVSDKLIAGWHTGASEDDMELLERGNVWNFFHDEPLYFKDTREEAQFFMLLGHCDEVRNPINGLYQWTKDEALKAIQAGIAHAFTMGHGLFETILEPPTQITVYRFRNEHLGRRVAKMTLEGFGLA